MKSEILKQLIDEAAQCGFPDARLRDAAFAVLDCWVKDPDTTFALIFPSEDPAAAQTYRKTPMAKLLSKRAKVAMAPKAPEPDAAIEKPKPDAGDDISFDENKAAMLRMLGEIEEQKQMEGADIPKLLKIEADIRVKLNDKFEVASSAEEQLIVVQPKFNHVCEHTGRECWLQTKEFAMEHWGLEEKKPKKA